MPQEQDWFASVDADWFAQQDAPRDPREMNPGEQAADFASRVKAGGRTPDLSRDLSMAAGMAAGPGIILPAIAAGGAYFLGERAKGKSRPEAAEAGITEGALNAGVGTAMKGAATMGRNLLDTGALRWIKGGLKVPLSYLEHMSGAGKEGADAMEDRIARTVLSADVNPMRAKGVTALQKQIEGSARQYEAAVDAAPATPITGVSRRALNATHRVSGDRINQTAPTKDLKQVEAVRKSMIEHPRYGVDPNNPQAGLADTTPRQTADMIAADNKVLSESFGKTPKIARLDAIKAARASRADDLDAVAGTKAITTRMRDLIDLRNVSDLARQRAGKRDAIGITDIISLSSARPAVLAATTMMRPSIQVGTGRMMGKTAQRLAGLDANWQLREVIRALLGQASHGQE
jgi:hypothetical protein